MPKIRKASLKEIDYLLEITKACAKNMIAKRIYQWNDEYPSYKAFKNDFNRNELYVLEINTTIVGCITISFFMDSEYDSVQWLTQNKNNIYIHRLAVHPQYQKKGYAQLLMNFAEKFARKNNANSIRLDTFSVNERNNKFYKQRGYKKTGEVYFYKQSEFSFYCYELILHYAS